MTGFIGAAALAIAIAASAQTPTSDRVLDAAGVKLHIQCEGDRKAGAPLVLLEAGAGNSANTWRDVFGPIGQIARVCAYDRPGLGTSAQTPQPRRPMEIIETLHALLGAAGERAPYVMVGHSWGGEIVRLYAMHYPTEITGLVLIDSSHEDQVQRFAAVTPAAPSGNGGRFGVTPPVIPEQADLVAMGAELGKSPWHGNIPLVVLTRTPPVDPRADPRGAIWQELQKELATRSPQAEHVVATKSGHYVQNDEPQLVIDAVRRVVAKATTRE